MKTMKLAMFGGTFNPMHRSHLYVMEEALEKLEIDKILVMPTYTPPHKIPTDLVSPKHRLAMCNLTIAGNSKLETCDYETKKESPSYTYKTLGWIKDKYNTGKIYLLVGSDMFLTLEKWKNPATIFQLTTICVVARSDSDRSKVQQYQKYLANKGVESIMLNSVSKPMNSTMIRSRIKNNEPVEEYLTKPVISYIDQHNLYQ